MDPAGPDITVPAGRRIAVQASAAGADGYRWELQGDGEISSTEGDVILYTAPEQVGEGGTMALLTIVAYNDGGESPQTSLVINVGAPSPTITIEAPLAEVECPLDDECRFSVEGTSSGVASDPDLGVVVFVSPQWSDQWFPHRPFSVDSDGTWPGHAQIGDRPCWPAGDVDLVTTYASVSIDLSHASPSYDDRGASISLSEQEETSLAIDYDLGTGSWVLVTVPVYNLDMSCMREAGFSITFSLEGTGAANSLEVRLEDTDYTNYGWRRPRGSVTTDLETIELPLALFEFFWDGDEQDTDMDWQQVMNILFAVSQHPGDAGGAGQVTVSDVILIPPAAP
jgi:hypothetical protein